MRVLLLGATGTIGRRVAGELVRHDRVREVVLAGRRTESLERLAGILGGDHVRTVPVDATEADEVADAAEGCDVIASAAGPGYALEGSSIEGALRAGTHYVSLNDDAEAASKAIARNDHAEAAGVAIVSGCGASPGMTNLLVSRGRARVGDIEEVGVALAASAAESTGAASALHLAHSLGSEAVEIDSGIEVSERAGTKPRPVYFPDPVGWVETFRTGHPEVAYLRRQYPDAQTLGFRIGLTEKAVMDVLRASAASGLFNGENRRQTWLRMTSPMRPFFVSLPPRGSRWSALRVNVWGRDGGSHEVSYGAADHIANLAAIPLALAAVELGSGAARRPGVLAPDEAFDAREMLRAITQRGVRVAVLEPEKL